jgi:general secretion pathway protein D
MNKQMIFTVLTCAILFTTCLAAEPTKNASTEHHKVSLPATNTVKKSKDKLSTEKLWFRYKDEPLVDIVSSLAKRKNINVVLPAGKEAIVNKLTFQYPEKITLSEAWRRMLTLLKMCGYTITKENNFYFITGTDPKRFKDANKQPYPLYSHVKPEDLPDSDEKIRYIHYFSNLQVGNGKNGVMPLIKELLSKDAVIVTDPSSNGLIITDYARNIAAVMRIIIELDSHGFTDAIDLVQLKHTAADTVAKLFKNLIDSNSSPHGTQGQAPTDNSQSQYFTKSTRIVAELRTNSLILMGKKEALTQARNFIEKHIDIPLGEGESVLHIYDLQYLKASEFLPVLQSIVSSSGGQKGSQSSGSVKSSNGEQYFEGVIIAAESTGGGTQNSSGGSAAGQSAQTSNRLVIAARRQDWIRIEKLIEELDRPQLQVAIEALIVDLSLTSNKILASQMRNKKGLGIKNTNFQTSNLGSVVLDNSTTTQNADALMANLLNMATGAASGVPAGTTQSNQSTNNILSSSPAGSLLLSFKDKATKGMWLITQLLSNFKDVKVLSQPFIVALNNQTSVFSQKDSRLLDGDVTTSLGGTVRQKTRRNAILELNVTPLISNGGKVNLGIKITVEEYGTPTETLSRQLQTNANINDGEVLVLGGLTKTKVSDTVTGTPGLQHIPLFGWLFKKKSKLITKENLLIFLCPRIIQTTPNKYFDPYTKDKMLAMNKVLIEGENFDTLKDPITHWFFGSPDSEVATNKIKAFKHRTMYSADQNYLIDKQRAGVKTITINPKQQLDHKSIMQKTGYVSPPAAQEKTIENYIKAKESPKKTYTAQSTRELVIEKHNPKVMLSEEEQLRKLFASLDSPPAT